MSRSQSFTFQPTGLSLIFSIIALVVVLILAWQAIRRSNFQRTTVLLETFRVLLVLAAIALLNQPEWKQEFHPDEKPTVAILLDQSFSMRTRDEQQPKQSAFLLRVRALLRDTRQLRSLLNSLRPRGRSATSVGRPSIFERRSGWTQRLGGPARFRFEGFYESPSGCLGE